MRAQAGGGTLDTMSSVINGGTVTFTSDTKATAGSISGMVLSRNGQTLLTIDSGSFQATKP